MESRTKACSGGSKDLSLESTAVIQMGSSGSLDQCGTGEGYDK